MTLTDLSPIANHLWQSTLCAAVAWLLTLTLQKNRASVRYWLWLAASAKFLIPFSMLAAAGSLAKKKMVPVSAGTFPTHGGLFVVWLVGVILIVGGLLYFPAQALGPIVEHFQVLDVVAKQH